MSGWVYGGSSAATPGGEDTNIQFNNNGALSGSGKLITDGSGSLSASLHISASSFYGDGSNLTGVTASAVQVADGPKEAIQFRVDTPVSGDISGSAAFMYLTSSKTVKLAGASLSSSLNISASNFYLTPGNSIFFNGNTKTAKITNNGNNLDINSPQNIILNGKVGVSTTSAPEASLHVSSSVENASLFRVDTGVAALTDALLFVTSSGLVGINTSAPSNASSGDTVLDVNGHISVGKSGTGIIFNNTDTNTFIKLGGTATGDEMSFV